MTWRHERAIIGLFCEDIRQEIGGQVSLIGIFPRDIVVPQMPIIIPKLGLSLMFNFPLDQIPLSIRMKIVAPWSPEPLFEIAHDGFRDAAMTVKRVNDAGIGGRTFHILSPFMIQEPGIIRVLITIDGEDISAGSIEIALASPDSNQQPRP